MRTKTTLLSLVATMVVAATFAGFAGTDVFVASVGRGPGAAGSEWYTTVWVHNPNSSPANVQFALLERDKSNTTPMTYNDTIPAGDTRRYDNAIWTMFADEKFGALHVTSNLKVIVNSRVYSMGNNQEAKDSVGQFFSAVPASFAIGAGQKTQLLGVFQTSPKSESQFRYNFGFVETTGGTAIVRVHAFDETGSEVTSKDYSLAAFEARQYPAENLLPSINAQNLRLEVEVLSGTGKVIAFGSGLANRSNDPSTFEMSFSESLLASGGAGLTLPYSGTVSSSDNAFAVANTGSGNALLATSNGANGLVARSTSGNGIVASSTSGNGVVANSTNGNGVVASSTNGNGIIGTTGSSYAGVFGEHTGSGTAVFGKSVSGTGVAGNVTATTGGGTGVWGEVASDDTWARGVVGWATSTTGPTKGVWGESLSSDANSAGVWAVANGGSGLYATSTGGNGVTARSTSGNAVAASSTTGNGLNAQSTSGNAILASSTNGNGINVSTTNGNGVLVSVTSGNAVLARVTTSGNVILGQFGGTNAFRVDTAGEVYARGSFHPGGADVAEFITATDRLEPGDVVEIDPLHPGLFRRAATAAGTTVAGVLSTRPGVVMNSAELDDPQLASGPRLALVGRVPVKASAENGAIRPGDLLVAAATPGHAMRAPGNPAMGSVIGKALGVLESGTGTVEMLVMLR